MQLSKLNTNMESVLARIADHESRLTRLENEQHDKQTRSDTWMQALDLFKKIGSGVFYGLVLLGAAYGIRPLATLLGLMSN